MEQTDFLSWCEHNNWICIDIDLDIWINDMDGIIKNSKQLFEIYTKAKYAKNMQNVWC